MNEPTKNEPTDYYEDAFHFDWKRPMSPHSMFSRVERDIIIACINILTDEYYFCERDFRTLIDADAKPRFAKIIDKIRDNVDLNEAEGEDIAQAVLQVGGFPMRHAGEVISQFEARFSLQMYQLRWFTSDIRNRFTSEYSELEKELKSG